MRRLAIGLGRPSIEDALPAARAAGNGVGADVGEVVLALPQTAWARHALLLFVFEKLLGVGQRSLPAQDSGRAS